MTSYSETEYSTNQWQIDEAVLVLPLLEHMELEYLSKLKVIVLIYLITTENILSSFPCIRKFYWFRVLS